MKVPMSRITIYGSKKDRKAVLEFLQRQQCVDISEGGDENAELGFSNMNTTDSQSEFMRERTVGEKALDILERYAPSEKGLLSSFEGRKTLSAEEYYKYVDDIPEMMRIANRITEAADEIAERRGRIVRRMTELDELSPWMGLDVPLSETGTKESACLIGTFPEALTEEKLLERYYSEDGVPPVYAEIVNVLPQQTCAFMLCSKKHAAECENRLRAIGYSGMKTSNRGIPAERAEQARREISALEDEIAALEKEIVSYKGARSSLQFMVDYYAMRTEKYNVLSKLSQRNRVFVITGYVPTKAAPSLTAALEHKYNAAVETEDAPEDAPVMLKNKYLTEPVEGIVRTFAMPTKGEIDPTGIMAFFYYILFGMMLSDAAYGLIMTLGCFFALKKFKSMEPDMKKTLRMFMYCGISTMFWGVMFGSYFGDVVPTVSRTFFGKEVTIPPLWFEPVKDPMKMLMFSFVIGIIHLFTGLGIKLYQCIKAKDWAAAFGDCIFWYMLVGGGILYLFRVDMFLSMAGLTTKLPAVWGTVAAVIAGIGALGILLFTAPQNKMGKRLAKGAYSLYGVTSWLSDILSYSRLLALGLATGVIATVFNKMGSMFGGGVVGAIIFVIVFVIGHTLNLGINALGAYVHTNRLQFVEFFGKFFEGGGREFSPFAAHTKYYKFKEEI